MNRSASRFGILDFYLLFLFIYVFINLHIIPEDNHEKHVQSKVKNIKILNTYFTYRHIHFIIFTFLSLDQQKEKVYIYIYIYIYVCMCVCGWGLLCMKESCLCLLKIKLTCFIETRFFSQLNDPKREQNIQTRLDFSASWREVGWLSLFPRFQSFPATKIYLYFFYSGFVLTNVRAWLEYIGCSFGWSDYFLVAFVIEF